jgi:hypothetical protein
VLEYRRQTETGLGIVEATHLSNIATPESPDFFALYMALSASLSKASILLSSECNNLKPILLPTVSEVSPEMIGLETCIGNTAVPIDPVLIAFDLAKLHSFKLPNCLKLDCKLRSELRCLCKTSNSTEADAKEVSIGLKMKNHEETKLPFAASGQGSGALLST